MPSAPSAPSRARVAVRRRTRSRSLGRISTIAAWTLVVLFTVAPIGYLALLSVSPQADILGGSLIPSRLALNNWPQAFGAIDVSSYIQNSLAAATLGAATTIVVSVPGAYAMTRYRLMGGRAAGLVVGTYIAPPILAIFPLFYLLRTLELTNSVVGLGLVYGLANVPVAVWLLEGFVHRVPYEIEEAARVDGAGQVRILGTIVVPLMAPGIAATAILSFILSYNEFLLARFFMSSSGSQTIPIAISLFQGDRQVQFGQMAAVSLAALIPVYLLAVFFQRWIVGGLTHGAEK